MPAHTRVINGPGRSCRFPAPEAAGARGERCLAPGQAGGWVAALRRIFPCGILEQGRPCCFVNEFEQLLSEAVGSNNKMPGGNEDVTDIPGDMNF